MRLRWSEAALADRRDIQAYIWEESPKAAISVDRRIATRARQLRRHPFMGRQGRAGGTRELVVTRTRYILAYHVAERTVTILRVIHGAMRWPESIPD